MSKQVKITANSYQLDVTKLPASSVIVGADGKPLYVIVEAEFLRKHKCSLVAKGGVAYQQLDIYEMVE